MADRRLYEFGDFRLDPSERLLFCSNEHVPLPPKAIDMLLLLVERRGHIVDKDTLLKEIWPDTFVEEGSLAQNVFVLRKILTEGRDGKELIETISKRGYRFIAQVREVAPEVAPRALPEKAPPAPTPLARTGRRSLLWAAPLALAVISGAAYLGWHYYFPRSTLPARRIMIAVLPAQNLTGDAQEEYFADGLTEELIAQFGLLSPERYGVIARTSSMAYKKTDKTVAQIGKELGVDYILESSVRRGAKEMRLTVQLIRVRDQTHMWVHEYDHAATNALAVQTEVTQGVAKELAVILTPRQGPQPTVSQEAYELYLRGRFHWNERSVEGLAKGIEYFQKAIAKDPGYARAYAGLADCYQLQVYFDQLRSSEGFPKARAAALKAVALDDKLAEAHTSLASIKGDFEWDWKGAEAEYKRAIELNPNYATAHHWYADFLAGLGRLEEGTAEIKRAHEIDPLSPVIGVTLGQMYCRADHCDQGIDEYKKILEMYPNFLQAKGALIEGYAQLGMYQNSIAELQAPPWSTPNPAVLWGDTLWGYTLAVSNRRQEALEFAEEVKKRKNREHTDYTLAVIYAGVGDREQAFARLESARRSHDFWMPSFRSDSKFASLRSDPRYKELLRRMNISTEWH